MKTVKEIYDRITDRPQTEVLFAPMFTKQEADEFIEEHYEDDEQKPLTDDEWFEVVQKMGNDDAVWQELISCWNYAIEKVITNREKGKVNGSSK